MSNEQSQKSAFISGEGDAWFRRNPLDMDRHLEDPWNRRLAELISEQISLIEIGCADGRRLAAIRELSGTSAPFSGVEPSTAAVTAGKELFPELDLRVGTAEMTGVSEAFDIVLFGFCLCWCDRSSLLPSIAEADRLLKDGGFMAIMDFDPPGPVKRSYHHLDGLWTYKMDYAALFLASPAYSLVEKHTKRVAVNSGDESRVRPEDLTSFWILRKSESDAYREYS